MTMHYKGLTKLIEECGELNQIAAKKQAYFDTDVHPDGKGSMKRRLEEEIADVTAACRFVCAVLDLDVDFIEQRHETKHDRFYRWNSQPDGQHISERIIGENIETDYSKFKHEITDKEIDKILDDLERISEAHSRRVTEEMISRFLSWKLPKDFSPDAGISFKPEFNENTPWPMKHEPTGTNLLNYTQAKEMLEYILNENDHPR